MAEGEAADSVVAIADEDAADVSEFDPLDPAVATFHPPPPPPEEEEVDRYTEDNNNENDIPPRATVAVGGGGGGGSRKRSGGGSTRKRIRFAIDAQPPHPPPPPPQPVPSPSYHMQPPAANVVAVDQHWARAPHEPPRVVDRGGGAVTTIVTSGAPPYSDAQYSSGKNKRNEKRKDGDVLNYKERRRKHKMKKLRRKMKLMRKHFMGPPQPIVIRPPPSPQAASNNAASAAAATEIQQLRAQLTELQAQTLRQQHAHTQLLNQLQQQTVLRNYVLNENVNALAAQAAVSNENAQRAIDAHRLETIQQQQQDAPKVVVHDPISLAIAEPPPTSQREASTDPPPEVVSEDYYTTHETSQRYPLGRRTADYVVDVIRLDSENLLGKIAPEVLSYYTLNENIIQQVTDFIRANPNCMHALRSHGLFLDSTVKDPHELLQWIKLKIQTDSRSEVNNVLAILNAPFSCYTYPTHPTRGVLPQARKKNWRKEFYQKHLRAPNLDEERDKDAEIARQDAQEKLVKKMLPSNTPAAAAAAAPAVGGGVKLLIKTTTDKYGNSHVQPIVTPSDGASVGADTGGGTGNGSGGGGVTIQRADGTTEHITEIALPTAAPVMLEPVATRAYLMSERDRRRNRLAEIMGGGTEYGDRSYAIQALHDSMQKPSSMSKTVPKLYDALINNRVL